MTLMRQFRRYAPVDFDAYRRFMVADIHVGWIEPGFALELAEFPHVFAVDESAVSLQPRLEDFDARSDAMAEVLAVLKSRGRIPGWRDEYYPVGQGFHAPVLLRMERAATPLFGVVTYGVNLNGYIGRGYGMMIWIAKRAATKHIDPGMLDLIVGGGQPAEMTPWDNLMKECREEAGMPLEIARRAKPAGVVTLMIRAQEGLRLGLQFNYDLELPKDFMPRNTDGEVEGFQLVPVSELMESLKAKDEFMFDVAVVQIDFLIRHGLIGPEDPEYLDLIARLRQPIPFAA